jgi:hypothetical protein
MATLPNLDQLPQVQELNRAFLEFIQARARRALDCLGMPAGACAALCQTTDVLLDAVALFPRALFRLCLERDPSDSQRAEESPPYEPAYHDLCLSILWAARQTSRQSAYQARLLFGLDEHGLRVLQTLPLAKLQRFASARDVLRCAFADREWLWRELLTDARPESRQQLALVGLQPGVERDWPERRPARPVA